MDQGNSLGTTPLEEERRTSVMHFFCWDRLCPTPCCNLSRMTKYGQLMVRSVKTTVILWVLGTLSSSAATPGAEFRGLWVDAFGPGFFNAEQVEQLVADCRNYNFNAVIVEMRRRGDAFYMPESPNPDPRTVELTNNFDALAEIIRQCHSGTPRIEVHCWVVSHLVWAWKRPPPQTNHVFNAHPEYLTRDSLGQKLIANAYYLDPGHPGTGQWLHDVAMDIVRRYDVDGLHWDYCRYPARDAGYNTTAIGRYNEEFGLKGEPKPDDPRFCEWRRRQVTDFLRWVHADLLELKPGLVTSIAVLSERMDAYGHRFQDWGAWNREGLIDVCMPMVFTTNNQHVFFPRVAAAATNMGIRHVYPGQGAYMNGLENTLAQLTHIRSNRSKAFPGTVVYSYRVSNNEALQQQTVFARIKEALQPEWTPTPPLPWKKSKGIIKGTVNAAGKPIYNAVVTIGTNRALKTEPHGAYAFFNLAPGTYNITATTDHCLSVTKSVSVGNGQVLALNFDLSFHNLNHIPNRASPDGLENGKSFRSSADLQSAVPQVFNLLRADNDAPSPALLPCVKDHRPLTPSLPPL
jgi:uncharacterized lipoprotein YddW (UPF0748 family)